MIDLDKHNLYLLGGKYTNDNKYYSLYGNKYLLNSEAITLDILKNIEQEEVGKLKGNPYTYVVVTR